MSREGWHGATVRKWRRYWAAKIASAEQAGTPLVCPWFTLDPGCPGPIHPRSVWDIDHAVQLVDGGDLGLANQRPAHTSCNRRAGQATARAQASATRTRIRRWA